VTRVNLLLSAPVHRRKAESSPDRRRSALACGVILALTGCSLVAWGLALHRRAVRVDLELAATRQDLARLRTVAADASALQRASRDMQERIDLLTQLRASQRAPLRVLEEIGRAVPGDCWLTAVVDDGPGRIRVGGHAPALSSLFQLVERLEGSKVFRSVEVLDSRAASEDPGPDLIEFSLIASLHGAGVHAAAPGVRPRLNAVAEGRPATERSR
jgi:Tfp pilus assembly protein PilN